ncbi:hypothetical protein LCGC14_3097800, partial [marine sediment metagenome]
EGQAHLIAQPIKIIGNERKVYDLMDWFVRNEYLYFPNAPKKDFLDALSRFYDMDPVPPMIINEADLVPETAEDD